MPAPTPKPEPKAPRENWDGDFPPPEPVWRTLGFASAEAWRRSFFSGLDTLDAEGKAQVPPPAEPKAPRELFWLVLAVLVVLSAFALCMLGILTLRDTAQQILTSPWSAK